MPQMIICDGDKSEDDNFEDDNFEDDSSEDDVVRTARTEKFSKLFYELECCREGEQMQKIEEMNELVEEMDEEEFKIILTKKQQKKLHQMVEEEIITWGDAIVLLKHICCIRELKSVNAYPNSEFSLSETMREMINDENEKNKEEKNEKFLTDLCESYVFLNAEYDSDESRSICAPCLLKVALKKEEDKETQKEVEIALLALINYAYYFAEEKLYLNEIKEIIQHHQKHRNLTQRSYQLGWELLIIRFLYERNLEDIIVNELHFVREARRVLEELIKCMDWKRKKEEGREAKEEIIIRRWLDEIYDFIDSCELWNEECSGLISSVVQVFRASRDNYEDISSLCLVLLRRASEKRVVKVEELEKRGVIGLLLEEMKQSTFDEDFLGDILIFFLNISRRLERNSDEETKDEENGEKEEKEDYEAEETKRKMLKRQLFERMEEEGFEDIIASLFGEIYYFVNAIAAFFKLC
eukprot:MONOS_7609.1-p1 / transcript=MONOS_7609.1 / gene=MONOS_7609 / organism=Monocercomonoides_exilis_PA203 / gene_product=unspecified product / transcript_product=unspecified product / location=Mono_scaffold00264:49375-51467(+) / protein_length=468 / sequence_SO=supercontig / SO=protein_coding / is_pseudo=false